MVPSTEKYLKYVYVDLTDSVLHGLYLCYEFFIRNRIMVHTSMASWKNLITEFFQN